jgi:hypothetical protein
MIESHGLGWKSTIDRRGSHGKVGAGGAQNYRCASKDEFSRTFYLSH